MDELDRRHGTYAGASAHWSDGEQLCDDCQIAATRYRKRNRYLHFVGQPATIPSLGTVRRIHALQALGWTHPQIAAAAGINLKTLRNPLHRGERVTRETADAIASAYDKLGMRLPTETTRLERRNATYARTLARKHGWLPPLAWDDIDHDETPRTTSRPKAVRGIDHVVVERILAGDRDLHATKEERHEVIRRWLADGRTQGALERLRPDWNVGRDLREMRASEMEEAS